MPDAWRSAFFVRGLSEPQKPATIMGHLENTMANTRYQLEGNAPQLYERETVQTLGRPLG